MQAKPQLSFIEAIKVCFAKYANFKGLAVALSSGGSICSA